MASTEPVDVLSTQGRVLISQILAQHGIEPHAFQLDGVAHSLAGKDVLATMATGSGKTGFYTFTMILIKAIAENPSLWPGVTFPKHPVMIIILPTKALQQDMRKNMSGFGLEVIAINQDETSAAQQMGVNLWNECIDKYDVVLLSPEQLTSVPFANLLKNKKFFERVVRFGVDEVHLINTWGKTFRNAFTQIGFMRVRLPTQANQKFTPLIATSATIRPGEPLESICRVLGLQQGSYHLVRRSNLRRDIRITVREMQSGIGGTTFPELDWLLDENGNTVVFAKTISLGFRIAAYLWKLGLSRNLPDLPDRIRLFNSANWASYNTETLGFLNNNPQATITIATDVLSVGWDSQYTQNCVVFGDPPDIDDFVQKIGRVGRNRKNVSSPRAFLYHTKGAMTVASVNTSTSGETDTSMASFLAATCYMRGIDEVYANPEVDPICLCSRCLRTPIVSHSQLCNCSKCQPEDQTALQVARPVVQRTRAKPGEGISKEMQAAGLSRFARLRMELYLKQDDNLPTTLLTPQAILPDDFALAIVKSIYTITSPASIAEIARKYGLQSLADNSSHLEAIFGIIEPCKEEFQAMRAAKSATRRAKKGAVLPKAQDVEPDFLVLAEKTSRTHTNLVIAPVVGGSAAIELEVEVNGEGDL